MKAIAFTRPHPTLLALGKLKVGTMQVKTRNVPWAYRGPLLIYTNTKTAQPGPVGAYGFSADDMPTKVVVCVANLVDVRLLTEKEKSELFKGYNKAHTKREIARALDGWHTYAMDYGYFFDKVYALKKPVPIRWPSTGTISNVPLSKELVAQLPKWALAAKPTTVQKKSERWNTTDPLKKDGKTLRIRYKDSDGRIGSGNFYWSKTEGTWIECDDPDGIGLYADDGYTVIGWKKAGRERSVEVQDMFCFGLGGSGSFL